MQVRKCSRCSIEKSLDDYHFKNKAKGTKRHICKPCWRIYHREHYLANKQKYIDNATARRKKNREQIYRHKESVPCADCNKKYPYYVMDFDHITGTKVLPVSTLLKGGVSIERLQKEISKCELVCANCHRQRTHNRLLAGMV